MGWLKDRWEDLFEDPLREIGILDSKKKKRENKKRFRDDMAERRSERQRMADLIQNLRDNPPEMPGPQAAGAPQMQSFDVQPGINPFAAAAQRAGFNDFQNAPRGNYARMPAQENIYTPPPMPIAPPPGKQPGATPPPINPISPPPGKRFVGNPGNFRRMNQQANALRGGGNNG